MLISKVILGLSIVVVGSKLIACGGSETVQPAIKLAKAYESPQCQPPAIPTAILQELASANIEVTVRSCGVDPEITVPASCAVPVTKYLVIDIPEYQKALAQSLGYKDLTSFPPLTVRAC